MLGCARSGLEREGLSWIDAWPWVLRTMTMTKRGGRDKGEFLWELRLEVIGGVTRYVKPALIRLLPTLTHSLNGVQDLYREKRREGGENESADITPCCFDTRGGRTHMSLFFPFLFLYFILIFL